MVSDALRKQTKNATFKKGGINGNYNATRDFCFEFINEFWGCKMKTLTVILGITFVINIVADLVISNYLAAMGFGCALIVLAPQFFPEDEE
jgi:type III secretory pathway component EscU